MGKDLVLVDIRCDLGPRVGPRRKDERLEKQPYKCTPLLAPEGLDAGWWDRRHLIPLGEVLEGGLGLKREDVLAEELRGPVLLFEHCSHVGGVLMKMIRGLRPLLGGKRRWVGGEVVGRVVGKCWGAQ